MKKKLFAEMTIDEQNEELSDMRSNMALHQNYLEDKWPRSSTPPVCASWTLIEDGQTLLYRNPWTGEVIWTADIRPIDANKVEIMVGDPLLYAVNEGAKGASIHQGVVVDIGLPKYNAGGLDRPILVQDNKTGKKKWLPRPSCHMVRSLIR